MRATEETLADAAQTHPTMRAVVLDRFGGAEELTTRRVPRPAVRDQDVLIKVAVAGVGSWDAVERQGHYDGVFGVPSSFPYILGWDAAGTVAAVGGDVTEFAVGDRVYAATMPVPRGGAYAEYVVVAAEHVAPLPARVPFEQAGAMAWDAVTAMSGVDLLELDRGDSVMVFGASGGVGHMAVQLARHHGLRVLAVASGADGVELVKSLGADAAVDGRAEDVFAAAQEFAPGGLDGAIVTAGGEAAERALLAVKSTGRIAWPNGVTPPPQRTPQATLTTYDGDRSRAGLERLNAIIDSSDFQVHIAQSFTLDEVRSAHLALRDHYVGKLALTIGADEGPRPA